MARRKADGNPTESGYQGRDAVRKNIYIFPNQLETLEKIAADRGVPMRWIFFECFGLYIGTYLQEEADRKARIGRGKK